MPKHLMIAIDWYGPFTLDVACEAAERDFSHGLYMCLGLCKNERTSKLQYIGIGTNIHKRLKLREEHHKLSLVTRKQQIWLGEVATAEPSGKRIKYTKATLDYAEWLHARFLQLPLNSKKTKRVPDRSATVLNRWFDVDYETIRKRRPHPDWPDLIDYPAYGLPARAIWFGSRKPKLFLAPSYAEP